MNLFQQSHLPRRMVSCCVLNWLLQIGKITMLQELFYLFLLQNLDSLACHWYWVHHHFFVISYVFEHGEISIVYSLGRATRTVLNLHAAQGYQTSFCKCSFFSHIFLMIDDGLKSRKLWRKRERWWLAIDTDERDCMVEFFSFYQ